MVTKHELSRPVVVDRLPVGGRPFELEASAGERAALAARLELPAIEALRARGRVDYRGADTLIAVTGEVEAELVRSCVVTLEPMTQRLSFAFERLFTTEPETAADELVLDPEQELPEPIAHGVIDVGEVVAEELAVNLDPYPRAPEADDALRALAGEPEATGPFAALAALRGRAGEPGQGR